MKKIKYSRKGVLDNITQRFPDMRTIQEGPRVIPSHYGLEL